MPEPIARISGRVDSVAALFYLGAFRASLDSGSMQARRSERASHLQAEGAARRRGAWLVAALLIFICGLFAKQTLVTFPLLVLAYDVAGGRTPRRLTPSRAAFTICASLAIRAHRCRIPGVSARSIRKRGS